jgi:predicted permease
MSLFRRFTAAFRNREVDDRIDDELQFHIEMRTKELISSGVPAEEARRRVLLRFGNQSLTKEKTRAAGMFVWLETVLQDIRYALRALRRSPVVTSVAVLSLALAMGANTAIFTLVNAVLLRTLPVREPQRLVQISSPNDFALDSAQEYVTHPLFDRLRTNGGRFIDLLAVGGVTTVAASVSGSDEKADRQPISGDAFAILGVGPVAGRLITPEDDGEPGKHPVAVLSYDYWRRRFNLDPAVVGRTIRLRNQAHQIVGVAQAGFSGADVGNMVDVWTPLSMEPLDRLTQNGYSWLRIVGRLKQGVTIGQALGPLQAAFHAELLERVKEAPPDAPGEMVRKFISQKLQASPAPRGFSELRTRFTKPLWIVMSVVALVLLLACTNVANLLLARATARKTEMAVRISIGAGRGRLLRQLLTESLLLAGLASFAGFLCALWGAPVLVGLLAPEDDPVRLVTAPDSHVFLFIAALCIVTALLFGLMPALRTSRTAGVRSARPGTRSRLGKALVVSQVAISMVLIVGAMLFLTTLRRLTTLDPGFDRRNVLLAGVRMTNPPTARAKVDAAWTELLRRAAAIPGVEAASLSSWSLFGGNTRTEAIYRPGKPLNDEMVYVLPVSREFFRTMGTPLISGRDFTSSSETPVAIVNQTFARLFFPGENPVGKLIGEDDSRSVWLRIVGLAQDAKYDNLRAAAPPMVYLPLEHNKEPFHGVTLELRTRLNAGSVAPALRKEIAAAGPNLKADEIVRQTKLVDDTLVQERLLAKLSTFFGALALLLAAIGLYGIMSYAIVRRRQEIGIRMALGAGQRRVLGMVLRESLAVVVVGSAIGIGAALLITPVVKSLLFGVSPADPVSMALSAATLLIVAAVAGFLPARRASRVDPMIALRYE